MNSVLNTNFAMIVLKFTLSAQAVELDYSLIQWHYKKDQASIKL